MVDFLKTAYVDLYNRIRKLKSKIDARSTEFDIDVSALFVQDTLDLLETLELETFRIIESGFLDFELLMPNNLYLYNKYILRYEFIDSNLAEIILQYDAAERFFNRLINKIYKESNILAIAKPIVTLTSNSKKYYWVEQIAGVEILALPRGEEECLLHLPNLYHEIAHLFCFKYQDGNMLSKFIAELKRYFHAEWVRIKNEKVKVETRHAELEEVRTLWETKWVWELACDLIATFLVGPAYVWTALILNTKAQGEDLLYRWKPNHPPDATRIRIILLMLDKLDLQFEREQINQVWTKFLALTKNPRPTHYKSYFPDQILELLVEEVFSFCKDARLVPISTLLKEPTTTFAVQLNETWSYARAHQSLFDIYERDFLLKLKRELGLIIDYENSTEEEEEDFGDLTQL
ncbi:hypothetical protein GCM10023189_44870 [Nibrella saemangeumensis]|uniref:Uncharacterized protein n=1 Tax=Nibrella saemangeumensis TaxID=1084526 RepID=A0ABP8NCL1_9BACT